MRAAKALPSADNGHVQFERRPAPRLVESFVAHIKRTGAPETFPGILLADLSKTEPFEKLADFELDGRRREVGDMAYCPMCRSPNKYLRGQLIYLPRLKAIAAIGHECADRRQQRRADREFSDRKNREKDENFLLDSLGKVGALVQAYETLGDTAKYARDVHRLLKRKASQFMSILRKVKDVDGRLSVFRDVSGASAFGLSDRWIEENFLGTLRGTIACTAKFDPKKEIDTIVQRLRTCNFPDASDESILRYVVALNERDLVFAAGAIRHAEGQLPKISKRIEDFWLFFDEHNLRLLAEWGAHDLQPNKFSLSWQSLNGLISVTILCQNEIARIIVDTRKAREGLSCETADRFSGQKNEESP